MYHLSFYAPESHVEEVKEALFSAGAGSIGNYKRCCFQFTGLGQFEPLEGSDPFIGTSGKLEKVKEVKVEMVCSDIIINSVLKLLKSVHPYEEPAYYVIKTLDL